MILRKLIAGAALAAMLFSSCTENKGRPEDTRVWKKKGDSIVNQTFDTLRKTLTRAIGEKGLAGAVEFCSTQALELTHAFTGEGITVKRSSDKLRNPANAPDSVETRILSSFLQLKTENGELKPVLEKDAAGNYHYFKPIMLQAMCLNCHGDKTTQIEPDVWSVIQQKYPADAAFDYKEGDLRGIWHIMFSKK